MFVLPPGYKTKTRYSIPGYIPHLHRAPQSESHISVNLEYIIELYSGPLKESKEDGGRKDSVASLPGGEQGAATTKSGTKLPPTDKDRRASHGGASGGGGNHDAVPIQVAVTRWKKRRFSSDGENICIATGEAQPQRRLSDGIKWVTTFKPSMTGGIIRQPEQDSSRQGSMHALQG